MSEQVADLKSSEKSQSGNSQHVKNKPWYFFRPPFDLFGIQPSFFISGEDKTVTWLGFISTIILVTAIITVSVFYSIDFFRNKDSKVYINDLVLDGPPTVSVSNKNFVMMFRHIYPESSPLFG